MRWEIALERRTRNRLNADITQRKLRSMAKLFEQNKSLGFTGTAAKLKDPEKVTDPESREEVYSYHAKIRVEREVSQAESDTVNKQFEYCLDLLNKQATLDGWCVSKRIVVTDDFPAISGDGSYKLPLIGDVEEEADSRPPIEIPELDENAYRQFFGGVYEREAHIRMIHDSMLMYQRSKGERRSHVLLEGGPATAKTTLFERFKIFYEHGLPDDLERVAFIDGPTMSKAGLENWMMQMAVSNKLPEVVCVEEIEKQNMDNLLTLLSVMGSGYIMKTNARIGRMKQLAKCVIWATCNDKQLLKGFRNGALWSRFTHKLHCKSPTRELMEKIVRDMCIKCGGDLRWVKPIIRFAYEEVIQATGVPMTDPREVLGLLDGGDRLLDGSYQQDFLTTRQVSEDASSGNFSST